MTPRPPRSKRTDTLFPSTTLCRSILKPPMLRTVDLDQLAAAVPTIARLIGARAARNTISPDTGLAHQLSQRLARSADVMTLGQILGCQCRSKIMIMFSDKRNNLIPDCIIHAPVARSATTT